MEFMGVIITTDKKLKLAVFKEETPKILKQLVKLYMYPNHESTQKWRQAIANCTRRAPKVKPFHKYPTKKDFLKNTWFIEEDSFLKWVEVMPEDYGDPTRDIDLNELYSACQQYFEWLANELATMGLVSRKSIYKKLINLGF